MLALKWKEISMVEIVHAIYAIVTFQAVLVIFRLMLLKKGSPLFAFSMAIDTCLHAKGF